VIVVKIFVKFMTIFLLFQIQVNFWPTGLKRCASCVEVDGFSVEF